MLCKTCRVSYGQVVFQTLSLGFILVVTHNKKVRYDYAASYGNCLPTFRDNLSVLSSRVGLLTLEDGTDTLF
jgi:hypothetical protein